MPDYMFLLESRLYPDQRAALLRVQRVAQALESNVYLTGGAVRDLISGMPIRDLDFSIEGNPHRFARELEKDKDGGGIRVVDEDERRRHVEIIFPGDVNASLAATHDLIYERPGAKPETRWAAIMEDLRRRDFALNAIAISLNPASRGLLLDPTNGLADLEKHEVRALSIHSFTNQPARLLRLVRYCVRMGFKMESRTAEWFALALERGLHKSLSGEDVGREVQQLAREDRPAAILKAWEARELVGALHPRLARRHPHYAALAALTKVRENLIAAGYSQGSVHRALVAPVTRATLARLKPRERASALSRMELRRAAADAVMHLETEAARAVKLLMSRKTASPRDAFAFLEALPLELLIFIQAEFSQAKALHKIKSYLHKWRPLRQALPVAELESLGVPRGPKFDKVIESLFDLQLAGKGRSPEDRTRLLRQLAGLKPIPKKKPKEEKTEEKRKEKRKATEPAVKAAPEKAPVAEKPPALKFALKPAKQAKAAPRKPPKPRPTRARRKPPSRKRR